MSAFAVIYAVVSKAPSLWRRAAGAMFELGRQWRRRARARRTLAMIARQGPHIVRDFGFDIEEVYSAAGEGDRIGSLAPVFDQQKPETVRFAVSDLLVTHEDAAPAVKRTDTPRPAFRPDANAGICCEDGLRS